MARQWHGWWHSGVVAQQCGAVRRWRLCGVRCAQQQPIAVNPGIDGADLADLEAHAATRVLAGACAHFHTTQPPCPSTGSLAHRPALSTWGRNTRTKFISHDLSSHCIFLEVSPLSAGATLHWSKHAAAPLPPSAAKDKGQRPAQLELLYHISLPCLHHLAGVGINALAGHQARRRVGAVRSAEEQDVRLRPGGGRCGGRLRACDQVAHATRERWIAGRAGGWHLWMA